MWDLGSGGAEQSPGQMKFLDGVWKSLESCGFSCWTIVGFRQKQRRTTGVEKRHVFRVSNSVGISLKSITPSFPFLLCCPFTLNFPSISTVQEQTQYNHRPKNQQWTEFRNPGLPPSSSFYASPFPLEEPVKFSNGSRWIWRCFGSFKGIVARIVWRASCSFVTGIKVVCPLHFDFLKIPECRVWGAAARF